MDYEGGASSAATATNAFNKVDANVMSGSQTDPSGPADDSSATSKVLFCDIFF